MFRVIERKLGDYALEIDGYVESIKCDDGTMVYRVKPEELEELFSMIEACLMDRYLRVNNEQL